MTNPRVLELWELLEAKKGNTAAQLSALSKWLDTVEGWSFGEQDFGETFKFFQSNASTAVACAGKFAEKLSQIYCPHIACAVRYVDNNAGAIEAVKKLATKCKDPHNVRIVLRAMAGKPLFCSCTELRAASEAFGDPLDVDVCRKIADEGSAERAAAEEARTQEDMREFDREQAQQLSSWYANAEKSGAIPLYIKFWKAWEKAKMGESPPVNSRDPMFAGADAQFNFMKLAGTGTIPFPFLNGISFLKKFTEPKFEVRQAIVKKGLLFYCKNTQVKGCIPLYKRVADIDTNITQEGEEGYAFTIRAKLSRRLGNGNPTCDWRIGGKTMKEAQEVLQKVLQHCTI